MTAKATWEYLIPSGYSMMSHFASLSLTQNDIIILILDTPGYLQNRETYEVGDIMNLDSFCPDCIKSIA